MHYIRPESAPPGSALGLWHGGRYWRLHIVHCTIGEVREQASGPPHTHDVYHIVLFESGKNRFVLDGAWVSASPGTLVLCPPGVAHDFGPRDPGRVSYHEITFQLDDGPEVLAAPFGHLLSEYAGTEVPPVPYRQELARADAAKLGQAMGRVAETLLEASEASQIRGSAAMLEVMAVVTEIAYAYSPSGRRVSRPGDPAMVAHRQILLRFAEPVAIAEVAGFAGVSEAHLTRCFRARYGMSPVQFRQELRLSAAVRLLQTSSLSCKEIAARLGFADVQTFTKAFARHRGQTPGALAKALRRRGRG